ncbi:MAG TPA: hypothetical protein VGL39_13420 [Jatrophihabitantaceae bacterium]|jgi:hypothetical protein
MRYAQDRRVWLGAGALAGLLLVLIGWFALVSPQLSSASSIRGQAAAAEQRNALLQSKIAKLQRQDADLDGLTARLRAALAELPVDSGLPEFTRQLSDQAKQHRVDLTSVSVGSVTPVTTAPATSTSTPRPDATGTSAPSTSAPAGKLYAIPVTLVSSGPARDQLAFVRAIQVDGPRRALVTATQLTPASGSSEASIDPASTMTTQVTIFTAPLAPSAAAQLDKLLHGDVSG